VVTLYVQLLNFSQAKLSDVAHKIFEENKVCLEVGGSHETSVHYDIVCVLVVAQHRHAVVNCVFGWHLFQFLHRFDEHIVKVFNSNLVISSILNQVVLAIHYHLNKTFVLRALLPNEVFKQLE